MSDMIGGVLKGAEIQSEPCDRPVTVREPDTVTVREEPCVFRKSGLAIWRAENTHGPCDVWPSRDIFSVTHEASGAQVCAYPTRFEAIGALLCALALTDWTKDMATVRASIQADRRKLGAVHALREGRLVIQRADAFPQTKARA